MNLLLDLFLTFAKVGLFTFGGGYAMIGIIEHACVETKHWISHDDMMNITVIAESTPGPIAINCATFVGYKKHGLLGAVIATLGLVLPSFIIIYLISMFLDHFLEFTLVANAFRGIKLAVGILIVDAAVKMLKKMQKKPLPRALMLLAAAGMMLANIFSLHVSSVSLMLLCGLVSLTLFCAKNSNGKEGAAK